MVDVMTCFMMDVDGGCDDMWMWMVDVTTDVL